MKGQLANLWSKVFPVTYDFNPLFIHHHAIRFHQNLKNREFTEAERLFTSQGPASQNLLLEAISEIIEVDTFFDEFLESKINPNLAHLLHGSLLLKRAWVYRGFGRGADLAEDNIQNMDHALAASENSLRLILNDKLYGQEACARYIRTLMGLNSTWEEINTVHLQMRAYSPDHLLGEINYLIASCEKWNGSHKKMFSHARKTANDCVDTPQMGALVASAHWEKLMHLERFEEDELETKSYRTNSQVIDEVNTYSVKLLGNANVDNYDHVVAHNVFAAFFCDFGRYDLAKPHFNFMKFRVISYPWSFFLEGDIQNMYNKSLNT